ncbi:MAG: efflux RND transporter permease subunit [Granulosicoccaceae bacterium]
MNSLIGWFARNSVAANLLMVFIIAMGLFTLSNRLPLEVFPSFELDRISIRAPFAGASPSEVEKGVTIKIEEAIQDVQGVKRITSSAIEGLGSVSLELESGADPQKVLDDAKQQVDQINDFPEDVDAPEIYIPIRNREVISVIVSADMPEKELRLLASSVRDDLEALPDVSSVALSGARRYEMSIEVSGDTLKQYNLSLPDIVNAINGSSLDAAAGSIQSDGGKLLLRTNAQAETAEDFRQIAIVSRPDGTRVNLGDIATVKDGFAEDKFEQTYNGVRTIEIDVFRTGLQSAITVADVVKHYIDEIQMTLPHGVTMGYWRDSSRTVKARLNTLLKSAVQGGLLILILLTLFLRFWVAVWVFVGVPVSILGGIALMPVFGVSINLLSLFAFILVLGIVVDDAIVTGENIYTHMRKNPDRINAAIEGAREVAVPVTFGVLTTVAAFVPLLMIEGVRGKIFMQIPLIVIPVLLFSIIESKFVLPAHMSHLNFHSNKRPNAFVRLQQRIADGFEWFIENAYQPVLASSLRNRYFVLSLFVGSAILVFSLVSAGHVRFIFFPRVASEIARVNLEMVDGTPFEITQGHIDRIAGQVQALQKKYVDPVSGESAIESVMTTTGSSGGSTFASNRGRIMFEIVPPEERTIDVSSRELIGELRKSIGAIAGAKNISYRAEIGRGGAPIDVQISGSDFAQLKKAAALIKIELASYTGTSEISDSFEGGKQELKLKLKPQAALLGITPAVISRQVRPAFMGSEVQSLQRNRDDVKVIVRYPAEERKSVDNLLRLGIVAPNGSSVPLDAVAEVELGRSYATITRVDRRRTINITADIDKQIADIEAIKADLARHSTGLQSQFPALRFSLEGEAREQRESFASLKSGLLFVTLVIYALLAIPFRSYLQPFMVMCVIPFGVVGGILGHMVMGMNLSIMSYMGMLALCGVVVNDSLVLVDYVNRRRREGVEHFDAVKKAGVARFRAVILTSLTTFFGLLPLIYETSTQAQFLIPMAVSLGFGILFATVVTLLLIPVNYLILEDLKSLLSNAVRRMRAAN